MVVLVIGVLAAIAIPSFLGQSLKAKDASAKSNVKRLSGMVEECKVQSQNADYSMCNSDAELGGTPGLDWGGQPGDVGMFGAAADSYIALGGLRVQDRRQPAHVLHREGRRRDLPPDLRSGQRRRLPGRQLLVARVPRPPATRERGGDRMPGPWT